MTNEQKFLKKLHKDLKRLGFGKEDEDIDGGDCVDLINNHFEELTRLVNMAKTENTVTAAMDKSVSAPARKSKGMSL